MKKIKNWDQFNNRSFKLTDDKIKKGDYFVKSHIEQVYKYLVSKNLQLGILAYFAPKTVHIKRVINLY